MGLGYKLSKANLEETGNLVPETAPEAQGAKGPKTATFDSVICPPMSTKETECHASIVGGNAPSGAGGNLGFRV